MKEVLEMYI